MENPNFWNLNWTEQLPIIDKLIKKDRKSYNTKEFFNQNGMKYKNALHQQYITAITMDSTTTEATLNC